MEQNQITLQSSLFAIRDNKSGTFGPPMLVESEIEARRQIVMAIRQDRERKMPISNFPQDFELWAMGMYDRKSGKLMQDPDRGEPRFLENVASLIAIDDEVRFGEGK